MRFPVDHIGYAVTDMERSISLYRDLFSLTVSHSEILSDRGIEIAFLKLPNTKIELLSPVAGSQSVLTKFLEKRGEGLHHVCYTVHDIGGELIRLESCGVRLIDKTSRPGAEGTLIAFLHPKSTGGVLTELCEYLDPL